MASTATSTKQKTGADAGTDANNAPIKGLVLSGGKGSRLRPFTYTNAKQLVPIANKPVIFYTFEQLVESGITDIGIVIGDTGEQVKAACGDGSQFGAKFTYIQQDAPLGLAHAVATARDFLGDSRFVLYLGDNFVMGGIASHVERFQANGNCSQILLHPVPNPEAFGIAQMDGSRVARIVEKPKENMGNLAVIGIYMFDPAVHEVIKTLRPSFRGELEITDAIQGLIDRGQRVDAEVMDRYWIDTGKMDDMLNANRTVLAAMTERRDGTVENCDIEGCVVIEAGARVEDSRLTGPLIIGRDSVVIGSQIGPNTAIDARCRIKGCRIEDSIVMEDSRIEDLHWPIAGSMIGRFVELSGGGPPDGQHKGRAYSLTLGDHSRIEMPDG